MQSHLHLRFLVAVGEFQTPKTPDIGNVAVLVKMSDPFE